MRLSAAALLVPALAAGFAAADFLQIVRACAAPGPSNCNADGSYSSFDFGGNYAFNAGDGCGDYTNSYLHTVCMDWAQNRGHAIVGDGREKRCFKKTSTSQRTCVAYYCDVTIWDQVACTW